MAFWKINIASPSHIDTLLEKEDVSLKEILEEPDLLQEIRTNSSKLLEYIKKPETLRQLVELIINEPDTSLDYKQQFKLPSIACEVLTFDVPDINEAIMANEEILSTICNVFRMEDSLNDLTASFVCKVLIILATRLPDPFLEFVQYYKADGVKTEDCSEDSQKETPEGDNKIVENGKANEDSPSDEQVEAAGDNCKEESKEKDGRTVSYLFVDMLLNHINNSAIKDLFNRMIECADYPQLRPKVVQWLADAQLVSKLVATLSADNSEQVVTNSAKCLCKIIKVGREKQTALQYTCPKDPLLDSIESTEMISEIVRLALPEKHEDLSSWTLCESMFILLTLLQYRKTTPNITDILLDAQCFAAYNAYTSSTEKNSGLSELDQKRARESVTKALNAITPRLDGFIAHLSNPVGLPDLSTTSEELSPCFGPVRLEIIKLISAIVATSEQSAHERLRELKALPVIFDLFFKYSLCSQLHNQVEGIVHAICTPPSTQAPEPAEGEEPAVVDKEASVIEKHVLFDQLFDECRLIERILDNYSTVPKEQKGFNGHLRLMANHIETMAETGNAFAPFHEEMMKKLGDDLAERWSTFVKGTLATVNKAFAPTMGSINTAPSCSEDDEQVDLRDMGVAMHDAIAAAQQTYVDYQMNQITASFIDQFGFKDDEFTDVDIPGIAEVPTPRVEDHSSDEDEEDGEDSKANRIDVWDGMGQPFNPWDLTGSSQGSGRAQADEEDAWADFGSLKGPDTSIASMESAESAGISSGDAVQVLSPRPATDTINDDWADFESFKAEAKHLPQDTEDEEF